LIFEVILFHDPWRAQAAAIQVVLDVILLKHDFFENLGERVTALIGGMFLGFGDGDGMRINEMPHARVAADHDELLECGGGAAGFEQPEETFDRHIHNLLRRLFDGCEMQNMRDTVHCFFDEVAMLDGAVNVLNAWVRGEFAVVAQGANDERVKF
jgi:hypothetical protein